MLRLENKSTIITGAGRGIGKAIANKFLREGARVLLCDIVADRIEQTANELSALGETHWLAGDVSQPSFCDAVVATAQQAFGGINVWLAERDPRSRCTTTRRRRSPQIGTEW